MKTFERVLFAIFTTLVIWAGILGIVGAGMVVYLVYKMFGTLPALAFGLTVAFLIMGWCASGDEESDSY